MENKKLIQNHAVKKSNVRTPENLLILLHNQTEICSQYLFKVTPKLMKELVKFGIDNISYRGKEEAIRGFTKEQVDKVINIALDIDPYPECYIGFRKGQPVLASIKDDSNFICFKLNELVENVLGNFWRQTWTKKDAF
jgi:hypothetical protein